MSFQRQCRPRVLVTGGAGYIGSHVVRLLASLGYPTFVIDDLSNGHRQALSSEIPILVSDIGNESAVRGFLKEYRPEIVVHCAALIDVSESMREPEKYFSNNFEKPVSFIQVAQEEGAQKLIFCSTAAVYGEPKTSPIPEDHACLPINSYGASKLRFEKFLTARSEKTGLAAISFRFFNVCGAWEDGSIGEAHRNETHLIPLIIQNCLNLKPCFIYGADYPTFDGTCIRDFFHVVDLASAIELGFRHLSPNQNKIYNLGTEVGFSVKQIIQAVEKSLGKSAIIEIQSRRAGDPPSLVASPKKAKDELHWAPYNSSLCKMIDDALRWHRLNPTGYKQLS